MAQFVATEKWRLLFGVLEPSLDFERTNQRSRFKMAPSFREGNGQSDQSTTIS